jgi:phosphoglycerate dehydrogenase-like enzyme
VSRVKRIALTSVVAREGRHFVDVLSSDGCELVEHFELDGTRDTQRLSEGLAGAWATIAGSETYSAEVLERLPTLRLIARCGVGYDAIDVPSATTRGIAVTTTPGANSDAVADFTIGLMLSCLRRIAELDHSVREGRWIRSSVGADLTGATVGIVGLGAVGRGVARRLAGFDCTLLAVEPSPDLRVCSELSIDVLPLPEVLARVDVLTIHTPLVRETEGLIGASELSLMRPSAILVSTARGGIVSEDALARALEAGLIAGAALDVFQFEPLPREHPLLRLNNVVLTPHVAAFSNNALQSTLASVVASVRHALAGELPATCINPEVELQVDSSRRTKEKQS